MNNGFVLPPKVGQIAIQDKPNRWCLIINSIFVYVPGCIVNMHHVHNACLKCNWKCIIFNFLFSIISIILSWTTVNCSHSDFYFHLASYKLLNSGPLCSSGPLFWIANVTTITPTVAMVGFVVSVVRFPSSAAGIINPCKNYTTVKRCVYKYLQI